MGLLLREDGLAGPLPPPCSEGFLLAISSPKDEQRGPHFSGVGQVIQILAPESLTLPALPSVVSALEAPGARHT